MNKIVRTTKKKIVSYLLLFVMLVNSFQMTLFGNVQIPVESVWVDNVYYTLGENLITGDTMIRPTMTVSWKDPENWASAIDPADIHSPDYYDVEVKNLTTGELGKTTVNSGSTEFTNKKIAVHEEVYLKTGSLYQIQVKPYHYHYTDGVPSVAQVSGIAKSAYAITDPEVDFQSDSDSINVIWDNLGVAEFQYRIIYARGDYDTRADVINNKVGEVSGITSNTVGVTSFYDATSSRQKLSYNLTSNIYPGQIYSVIVEPIVSFFNGIAVTRNRNFPVINTVSTNIELNYREEGEYLRLQWNIPAEFRVESGEGQYKLTEARLIQGTDGETIAIFEEDSGTIGYYLVPKPIIDTTYQLILTYEANIGGITQKLDPSPMSNELLYSPSQLMVRPTAPYVPTFFSKAILEDLKTQYTDAQIREIIAKEYLVPGFTSYLGKLDDIFDKKITYHVEPDNIAVNFVWSAFRRIDVDKTSSTYNQVITDLNVYYDTYVTDQLSALDAAPPISSNQRYSSLDTDSIIKNEYGDIVGFTRPLSFYYDFEEGALKTLVPNKIYYIRIVAKKISGSQELRSDPVTVSFYYDDEGDSFAPPLITKPPLRVVEEETTTTGITLGWKEEWIEVINTNRDPSLPLQDWTNEVWVTASGTVSDKEIEGAQYFAIYDRMSEVDRLKTYLASVGVNSATVDLQSRKIDLGSDPFSISRVEYKFAKIPYSSVQEAIKKRQDEGDTEYSFLEYFDDLSKNRDLLNWQKITTTVNQEDLDEVLYRQEGLTPNTSYLFVLLPYRVIYETMVIEAHYPTPIIVATEAEPIVVNPDPTVPSLYISGQTERSIDVTWTYNTDFTYEILYNRVDDIETAKSLPVAIPTSPSDPKYPTNGKPYEVTIKDLFPATGYYIYIQATQPATSKKSAWSNPVFGMTNDINNPNPPLGIGVAADKTMKKYGYDLAVTENSIAIQWLKHPEDVEELNEGKDVKIYYSYILEAANNDKFIEPQYLVSGDEDSIIPSSMELLEKNLVKYNNLISNRFYYFRMKTRVTVVGTEEDQLIVKESTYYSPTLRILTVPSDQEYDSGSDPALEILPSENYEIIYDKEKEELIYRFRDDEVDASGNADNNVDQRLITELIKQNVYVYDIDVANYDNKPISKRRIQIPYSILEAFYSYQVAMHIDAEALQMDIPYNAVMKEVHRQKDQYGVAPSVEIVIEDVDVYYAYPRMPENALSAVSVPQEISVKVQSSKVSKDLKYADQPITYGLSTNNRYQIYGKNPVVYALNPENRWETVQGNYDRVEGAYVMATRNIGSYGVFLMENSTEIVSTKPSHWSEPYKQKIDGMYTVLGLEGYNPDAAVKENELINILYNLVLENKKMDVSDYISNDMINTLVYSGIKQNSFKDRVNLNREEAIAMMMKTFEIRDNLTTPASLAMLQKANANAEIDQAYKNLIAKAATIGLVSDINQIRANSKITYGELFALWAKAEGGFQ